MGRDGGAWAIFPSRSQTSGPPGARAPGPLCGRSAPFFLLGALRHGGWRLLAWDQITGRDIAGRASMGLTFLRAHICPPDGGVLEPSEPGGRDQSAMSWPRPAPQSRKEVRRAPTTYPKPRTGRADFGPCSINKFFPNLGRVFRGP